jgi:RNA recognition motif-containing protein
MEIYVGNLDFKVSESDLESIFGEHGTVSSCKIITDKYSGRSKGFGFISMDNAEEANSAIEKLNGTKLGERDITVNEARPKKETY